LSDMPGMVLSGIPSDVHPQVKTLEDGRSYKVLDNLQIEPGKRLSFSVENLPQAPPWNRRLRWLAGLAVVGMVGGVVGAAVGGRRGGSSGGERELAGRRGRLLDELVRLEANQRKGRVGEQEYRDQRKLLMRELESIFARLGEAPPTQPPRASGG